VGYLQIWTKFNEFFVCNFGMAAFMVLVDLILAYDLLIYRKFDGSTFLAIPQSFFHHFGIPSWSWIAGFIFLVVGLYQYYAICSQNKAC